MKKSIIILNLFLCFHVRGQESINASGGVFYNNDESISYSISQVFYIQKQFSTGSITEGVQQTNKIINLKKDDYGLIDLNIELYPNPTVNYVVLDIKNQKLEEISYQLFTTNGKLICQEKIIKEKTVIEINNLVSSIYLLKVLNNNKHIKTFKIIKNN